MQVIGRLPGPINLSSISQNTNPHITQLTNHNITTITCLSTDRLPTWNIWEYAGTNMCKNFFYTQTSTYFYHITKNCLNFHFEALMIKMCNAVKYEKCWCKNSEFTFEKLSWQWRNDARLCMLPNSIPCYKVAIYVDITKMQGFCWLPDAGRPHI
jgi:hypothetical protein